MIQAALARLLEGHNLARDEAREVMNGIMRGEATPAQIGGFLIALRLKGETADEIAGCAEAMRSHVLAVAPEARGPRRHCRDGRRRSADVQHFYRRRARRSGGRRRRREAREPRRIVGLGLRRRPRGARVLARAAAGADRAARSTSSDSASSSRRRTIRRCAMRRRSGGSSQPGRSSTSWGRSTNPAGARAQVVGVYAPELVPTIADVLAQLGAQPRVRRPRRRRVDELSPAGPNLVCEVVERRRSTAARSTRLDFGVPRCAPSGPRGRDAG